MLSVINLLILCVLKKIKWLKEIFGFFFFKNFGRRKKFIYIFILIIFFLMYKDWIFDIIKYFKWYILLVKFVYISGILVLNKY